MGDFKTNTPTATPPDFEVKYENASASSFGREHAAPSQKDVASFEYASPRKKMGQPQEAITRAMGLQFADSLSRAHLQESAKRLYFVVVGVASEFKKYANANYHPKILFEKINRLLGNKLEHRDLIFGGLGLIIGGLVGYWLAVALCDRSQAYICMQAVQCFQYSGVEGVTVADDAVVPKDCGKDEVLVSVKAGALETIDINICNGYGAALRATLKKYFKYWRRHLPITLGRSCTGVVVEIGEKVTRLEVGDEVWLTSPFWAPGVLSQHVLSPEWYVARKPTRIGFESASSLPYAGGIALSAIHTARITPENAPAKRVLVVGGCSAVGCVLIQVLKLWKATVTVTCYERATPVAKALGIKDIIALRNEDCARLLKKELDMRESFDTIIITTGESDLNRKELRGYCRGDVISTLPQQLLRSDSLGFFMGAVFSLYIRSRCLLQRVFWGRIGGFGEAQISHVELDKLSELVEMGYLQTVVQEVFQAYDIEQAYAHVQSLDSIGSCVVTFR